MVPVNAPDLKKEFGTRIRAEKVRAIFFYFYGIYQMMLENKNYFPGIDRSTGLRPISSTDLSEIVGNDYHKYIARLMQLGIIERNDKPNGGKRYVVDMYSMLYRFRFGENIKSGDRKYRQEQITDKAQLNRIRKFFKSDYRRQRSEFLRENRWFEPHLRFIESLYLSKDATANANASNMRADKLHGVISRFNSGTGRFITRDDFGRRIHHRVSGLNAELRPYLKVKGSDELLIIADVKNAQPYLMGALLYHDHLLQLLPPEFVAVQPTIRLYREKPDTRLFFEDCANGLLNEKWMQLTGKSKAKSKQLLFRHIFYSAHGNHHDEENLSEEKMKARLLFSSMYPSVMKTLMDLKTFKKSELPIAHELSTRKGKSSRMYTTPSILAQRLETRIFLDVITRRLAEKGVAVATIHDAWVMKHGDLATFEEVFAEAFTELGIKAPQLKTEILKPDDNNIADEKREEKS